MNTCKQLLYITFMLLYANFSQSIYAQTTLSTGDLMIIGLNADGGTVNEISGEGAADEFLFILLEPVTSGTQIYFTDLGYIGNTYPFFQTNFNTGQCVSTPLSGDRGDVSSGLIRWNATSNLPAMTKVLVRVGPNVLATSEGTVTSIVATQTAGTPMSLSSSGETLHAFQGTLDGNNEPSAVTMLSALRYRTSWETPTWQCHYSPSISGNPNTGFDVVHTSNPDNVFYTGPLTGTKSAIQDSIQNLSKWEVNTNASIDFFPASAPVIARTVSFETPDWPNASSGQAEITPASQIDGLYRFTSSTKMFINGNAATEGSQSFWPTELESGESFTIATTTGEEFDFQQIKVDVYDSAAFFSSAEGFRDGVSTGVQTTGLGFAHYPVNSGVYTISFTNSIFDNVDSIKVTSSGLFGISINVYDEAVFQDPTLLPAGPSVAITSSTNPGCNGASSGSLTATVTGGTSNYDYVWSNGSSTLNTSSLTNTITSLSAGNYKIVVTDNNGLKDSTDITLTAPAALVAASVIDSNVSCNTFSDGGATASASGGTPPYSYAWSNSATTASITGVVSGTYNVTVTDANGCSSNSSVTITEPATLVAAAAVDSNVSCNTFSDGGATASATGGTTPYSYAWSNSATTASITGVIAGTYNVTITDANGCTSNSSVTITEPAVLAAASTVDSNVSCNTFSDGGATASATGGTPPYSYAWSNSATTASITGVVSGTYNVTVTDANGCSSNSSVTITEPATLVAAAAVDSNVSCNTFSDGGATASASGGTTPYSYAWSNSATTASITGVIAGTYNVTVTDANGCTSHSSVTITEPTTLAAAAAVDSNVSCNTFSDGGATASATGGTTPYSYAWSNSATTASITGVIAGTYNVTVTDANGCTSHSSVTITEPTTLVAAAAVDSNVSCNTFSDGGATALATGGTTPYSYAWSNSATTASITGVIAGTYNVTVTDANGCTSHSSVTITEPTTLVAAAAVDSNVSCNTFSDGGATASATGGTTPYSYAWSNSATTASITGVIAGTYNVTVTDANGCTSHSSVTITEPVLSESTDTVKATDSYEWIDGVTYTETTFGATHALTDINGCDSIITLDLTIINYCASRSTRNRFEWIKEVKIEDDIDNLSNANSGGYGDYTDQLLTVDTGDVVTVALTPGYKRRVYEEYWRIWADWNYDGDYNDPGEKVFEKKGKNVQTGTFTIPVNVDAEELGLRVSMRWKRYAPSCGNYSSGEVEDYRIKVNGAQGFVNPLPGRLMQNDNTELADIEIYEFIDVYPNPVNQGEFVTGFIRVEQTGERQLHIVNTLGQIVKTKSIICDEEENRFEVSTQGLSKGIYFISINYGHDVMKVLVQ